MRTILVVGLLLLAGCKSREPEQSTAPPVEVVEAVEPVIQADLADQALRFAQLQALISGVKDNLSVDGVNVQNDPPGWSGASWDTTELGGAADLIFKPDSRMADFYLELNSYTGNPVNLVGGSVEKVGPTDEALRVQAYCVTSGPFTGAVMETSRERDDTYLVQFLSASFIDLGRGNYSC
jgi:hypothetical protein